MMHRFVIEFENATEAGKAHLQTLSLKKIRLHHQVLSQISFNAYKFLIDQSEVIKAQENEKIYT